MTDKTTKEIERACRAVGWQVTFDGAGHLKVLAPGKAAVSLPCTPGDVRSQKNSIAKLRRIGLDVATKTLITAQCEDSWHRDQRGGRYCPTCRGTEVAEALDSQQP